MALSPCNTPGCPNLTRTTYCPAHQEGTTQRKARGLTGKRGSTRQWRNTRAEVIKRDGNRCTATTPTGRCSAITALEVHHLDGNPHNNTSGNLITVCFDHHPRGTA